MKRCVDGSQNRVVVRREGARRSRAAGQQKRANDRRAWYDFSSSSVVRPEDPTLGALSRPEVTMPKTPSTKPKCKSHTRAGGMCGNYPVPGATVCRYHGGSAPQVRAAAARRLAEAAVERRIGVLLATEGIVDSLDPASDLLDVVTRSGLWVRILGRLVDRLDVPDGTLSEVGPEMSGGDDSLGQLYGLDETAAGALAARPHILLNLYAAWLDRHARNCKLAIDAGIAERQVRLAEQQGELIVKVIRAALDELGLDTPDVIPVVARHLRAVS